MKKILFVHHGNVPGGAPTSLKNLATGLTSLDLFKIDIGCARYSMIPFFQSIEGVMARQYPKTSLSAGRWFIWGGFNTRLVVKSIFDLFLFPIFLIREVCFLKKNKPDIIHLNSSILWVTGVAASLLNIPIVWHDRETFQGGRFNFRRILYSKFLITLASKVICIGQMEYKMMGGKDTDKVDLIYNSLDDSYFNIDTYDKGTIRSALRLPEQKFVFLSLGGNSFRKGTFQLIQSLKQLNSEFTSVIAGNMPVPDRYKTGTLRRKILDFENWLINKKLKRYYSFFYTHRVVEAINSVDSVKLHCPGLLSDVKEYIKACDVLVFAGTTPHSARPVYEAWALKRPVIVFDSEVMRMDVDDGIDGLIIQEHTAEALARAIKYLKQNPEVCRQMGENGFKKAIKRFSLKNNTEKIHEVYQGILNENSL